MKQIKLQKITYSKGDSVEYVENVIHIYLVSSNNQDYVKIIYFNSNMSGKSEECLLIPIHNISTLYVQNSKDILFD